MGLGRTRMGRTLGRGWMGWPCMGRTWIRSGLGRSWLGRTWMGRRRGRRLLVLNSRRRRLGVAAPLHQGFRKTRQLAASTAASAREGRASFLIALVAMMVRLSA